MFSFLFWALGNHNAFWLLQKRKVQIYRSHLACKIKRRGAARGGGTPKNARDRVGRWMLGGSGAMTKRLAKKPSCGLSSPASLEALHGCLQIHGFPCPGAGCSGQRCRIGTWDPALPGAPAGSAPAPAALGAAASSSLPPPLLVISLTPRRHNPSLQGCFILIAPFLFVS